MLYKNKFLWIQSKIPLICLQKRSLYLRYHTNYVLALGASSQSKSVFIIAWSFMTVYMPDNNLFID